MFRVLGKQKFRGVIHSHVLAYLLMCALSKQRSYLIDTTNTSIGVLIRFKFKNSWKFCVAIFYVIVSE